MSKAFRDIRRGMGVFALMTGRHASFTREAYIEGDFISLNYGLDICILTPNHTIDILLDYYTGEPPLTKLSVSLRVRGRNISMVDYASIIHNKIILRGIRKDYIQNIIVSYLNNLGIPELVDLHTRSKTLGYNKVYSDTVYHLADVASKNSGYMRLMVTELGRLVVIARGSKETELLSRILLQGNPDVQQGGYIFRVEEVNIHNSGKKPLVNAGDVVNTENLRFLETTIKRLQSTRTIPY